MRHYIFRFLFISFYSAFSHFSFADSPVDSAARNSPPFSLGIRSHYGFIIPHTSVVRDISLSNPWGIEIDANWLLTGDKAWNYCNCYPKMGTTFTFFNFANPKVLGNTYTLLYYVEPFLSYSRKLNFSFRTGMGTAFMDRPYHAVNNPTNLFFSSTLSFLLQVNGALTYRINPYISIRAAGYYNHISNGGMKEPNKGINFPTASLGMDYTFRPVTLKDRQKIRGIGSLPKKTWWEATVLFTAKPIGAGEPKRYPIYGIMANVSRIISRRSALSAGADWIGDHSLKEKAERNAQRVDYNRVSFLGGHDLLIGRFTFSQYLGVYLYSPYRPKDPIYQRYSLRFKLSERIFTGVSLKAHRQTADFMDVRLGVRF